LEKQDTFITFKEFKGLKKTGDYAIYP